MKEAGIDTSTFMAHSTWGAATSKVKAVGVPMADILKEGIKALVQHSAGFIIDLPMTGLDSQY